jgi:hypothetical protein
VDGARRAGGLRQLEHGQTRQGARCGELPPVVGRAVDRVAGTMVNGFDVDALHLRSKKVSVRGDSLD